MLFYLVIYAPLLEAGWIIKAFGTSGVLACNLNFARLYIHITHHVSSKGYLELRKLSKTNYAQDSPLSISVSFS